MILSRRTLLSSLCAYPALGLLRGQEPTYSADVKVVNVFATVRDKKGQIIRDLTRGDFLLDEEGQPQTIRYFSAESDLPLTLGLLVDTSGSQVNVLPDERLASRRFCEQVLREDRDQAFVIHFDYDVELLQDLTSSRQKLEKAIRDLEVSRTQFQRPPGGGYPGGTRRRGGTSLYDAVLLGSDELMAHQKGRKAVIVLSDGMDNGSKVTLDDATRSAQRADTLVYCVLFADPNYYGRSGFGGPRRGRRGGYPRSNGIERPGKKIMERIAMETGGRFFEVSSREPIEKIYAAIEEDLRNQYSIGYTSDRSDTGAGYRHIHLTTKQKDLRVHAREGYYPA